MAYTVFAVSSSFVSFWIKWVSMGRVAFIYYGVYPLRQCFECPGEQNGLHHHEIQLGTNMLFKLKKNCFWSSQSNETLHACKCSGPTHVVIFFLVGAALFCLAARFKLNKMLRKPRPFPLRQTNAAYILGLLNTVFTYPLYSLQR